MGTIWDAIQYREQNFKEDWLFIITTDHGRDAQTGKNHGGQSDSERNTWLIMNKKPAQEVVKTAIGVAVLYYQKDWFGANALFSGASIAVTLYFIVSLGATFYFHYIERPSLSTSSPSMS